MANESARPATRYQFGDSALAAERLRRLAEVFNPSSRAFLSAQKLEDVCEIADLGCGPGCTSRMLAEVFPHARVLGIDSSEPFVHIAQDDADRRTRFIVGDVTRPLAGGPFDLIYCRYLLAHLAEPFAAVERWAGHLRPGGWMCLEENDWIRTTRSAFSRYLEIVTAMLAHEGQRLYVGSELDSHAGGSELRPLVSQVVPVEVADRTAALMFLPNLATWRDRPFVRDRYSAADLDQLRDDLQRLAERNSQDVSISFGLRRIVLARTV